jgi:signal peptidase II
LGIRVVCEDGWYAVIMHILFLAGLIIAADRVSKAIAVRQLIFARGEDRFIRLVLSRRPLIAGDTSSRTLIVLWVAAVACAVSALIYAPALHQNTFVTAGVAAVFAGAAGNLADQLVRGAVVDFIAIGRWPVFNLADVAIVAGAALVGASLISTGP